MSTTTNVNNVDETLKERGSRYGKFKDHAEITQDLMNRSQVFLRNRHGTVLEEKLTQSQLEALHMIYHKIGRILNGDPNYADSWIDIAGYAMLVANELEGVKR